MGGTGVAMVTRQEETVLQCKTRRRARVLLSPPPAGSPLSVPLIPRSDEVNREDPIQLDCFLHWSHHTEVVTTLLVDMHLFLNDIKPQT